MPPPPLPFWDSDGVKHLDWEPPPEAAEPNPYWVTLEADRVRLHDQVQQMLGATVKQSLFLANWTNKVRIY